MFDKLELWIRANNLFLKNKRIPSSWIKFHFFVYHNIISSLRNNYMIRHHKYTQIVVNGKYSNFVLGNFAFECWIVFYASKKITTIFCYRYILFDSVNSVYQNLSSTACKRLFSIYCNFTHTACFSVKFLFIGEFIIPYFSSKVNHFAPRRVLVPLQAGF